MDDDQIETSLTWLTQEELAGIVCTAARNHPDVMEAVHLAKQTRSSDRYAGVSEDFRVGLGDPILEVWKGIKMSREEEYVKSWTREKVFEFCNARGLWPSV